MNDERRIALAHLRRVACNLESVPFSERTALCVSSLALLIEDLAAGNPMAIQERVRVTLGLLEPTRDAF